MFPGIAPDEKLQKKTMNKSQLVRGVLFVSLLILSASCSEYQKLVKSTDTDLKFEKALAYYNNGDYKRAATLFSDVTRNYRATEKGEIADFIYADCLLKTKDYMMAGHYFTVFVQSYPNSQYTEEAQYNAAYCSYKQSPTARLDQTETNKALEGFQLFINLFPDSKRTKDATMLMDELRDKLAYKAYLNARTYYDMGSYLGNNYLSAVITARNTLDDFPDTKYREELSFLILDAKYKEAINSIEAKKDDRLRDTLDEYYSFINEYPESAYLANANKIFQDVTKLLK